MLEMFCTLTIDVNIPVVMVYYSFTRRNLRGELVMATHDLSELYFTPTFGYNYLEIQSLMQSSENTKYREEGKREGGKESGDSVQACTCYSDGPGAPAPHPAKDTHTAYFFLPISLPASTEVINEQETELLTHAKTILIRCLVS